MQKNTYTGKPGAPTGTPNVPYSAVMDRAFVGNEPTNRDAKYVEGESLINMLKEDLAAQRIDLDCYRGIIQYLGDQDPDTRRKLEDVLLAEGERTGESANRLTF